jgi:pyruvate kinase
MTMPRTKIVCTIGPSSSSPQILRELIRAGMNVARLNFSHGSHDGHRLTIALIREIAREENRPVGILQDLCGPKIRVGRLPEEGVPLVPGQPVVLTTTPVEGEPGRIPVSYPHLARDARAGDRILLADGLMELVVESTTGAELHCRVVTGGILTSHKGINLPTGSIQAPPLTPKDEADLAFGLENGVDFVALSFVRRAEDILDVRRRIHLAGSTTPIVAKIERHEALTQIDRIIEVSDAVMVARGDLGIDIALEAVPGVQKTIVRQANIAGKPVIIATQMLRSMVDAPRPTRAEATDVANAVLDGADAVMLSEETASGSYPVEAVRYMARIAESAETNYPHRYYMERIRPGGVSQTVAYAACVTAERLDAAAIVATTRSGATAMHIARFRPRPRIIALSPDAETVHRLTLVWGCAPFFLSIAEDTDEMIESAAASALDTGEVAPGDLVVITGGRPIYEAGTTNMLWVKRL